MAESLGEAFVEVLADTSPFGDSLSAGISDALDGIDADVSSALDGVGPAAEEAFGQIPDEARDAAGETTAAFDGVADEIQGSLDGISFERIADGIRDNLGKIAIGAAGASAGAEGLARSQQDLRFATQRLEGATGLTGGEINEMARSLSDATFPLDDVLELLEIGRQRGLEGADALAEYASFWDMVGDATGENGVALGEAGIALAALGIELGDEQEALDAFGFIAQETTGDVGEFLTFIERTGPELRDLGLDIDQTAGLLGAMEKELGMSGRMARQEFRTAVNEADGDLGEMLETLGLTEEQFETYTAQVAGSSEVIERNAEAFADTRTPMQNIQSQLSDLMFRFPAVTDAAGLMAAPLAAIGPAAAGLTHGVKALSMAKVGLTKVFAPLIAGFAKLAVAILTNPIFLIAAAVIALAVVLFHFREEIIEAIVGAWDWVKEKTTEFWDWIKGAISDAVDAVVGFVTDLRDRAIDLVRRLWNFYRDTWQRIFDFVRGIAQRIRDSVVGAITGLRDRALSIVSGLRDGIRQRFDAVVSFVRDIPARFLRGLGNLGRLLFDAGKKVIQGLWDGMRNIWDKATGWIGGLGDTIRNLKGPIEKDRVLLEDIGQAIIGGLGRGMEDEWHDVARQLSGINAEIPMTISPDSLADFGQAGALAVGGRRTGAQEINVTVMNPEPEPASTSLNRELRKLSAIGVFDA